MQSEDGMGAPQHRRTTREKLAIFRACFTGLSHVYGTYDPRTGRAWQVKRPVTDRVLLRHLQGRQPYGVHLLVKDRTRALAVDFDEHDLNPPMEFVVAARSYGVPSYIEVSKSKGYHVWMFFEGVGVLAAKARLLAQQILDDVGAANTEVFPKQDRLDDRATYGNWLVAPLFGRLVPCGRTVFVDEANPTQVLPDQWEFLANVQRISGSLLDDILEANGLNDIGSRSPRPEQPPSASVVHPSFGLPPCAQKMLTLGVSDCQRVACFRLAVQLKKAGLPQHIAVAALEAWAGNNKPRDGKGVITPQEIIEQAGWAYARDYRGCGCEDPAVRPYCDPRCPLQRPAPRGPTRGSGDSTGSQGGASGATRPSSEAKDERAGD